MRRAIQASARNLRSGNVETGGPNCTIIVPIHRFVRALPPICPRPSTDLELAMSFQLSGLPFEPFAALFSLSAAELAELDAQRVVATEKPGYPCRVSLADAEVGEELLLLPFAHMPARSPYRASG